MADLVVGTTGTTNNHGVTIVSGTSGLGSIAFVDAAAAPAFFQGLIWYNHADTYLAFTAGAEGWNAPHGMMLDDDGSLGIGTDTPGSKLDVKGTLRLSGSTSGYVGIAPAAVAGSTIYTLPSADGSVNQVLTTSGSGTLSWTTSIGDGYSLAASDGSPMEALHVDADGNVGIGTTSPAAMFHVSRTSSSASMAIEGSTRRWILSSDNSPDLFRIIDSTTGLSRLVIDNTGKIGMGTISPNEQLEITGNLRLPTTTSTTGTIKLGADRFIHTYGTDNTFVGINAGNFSLTGAALNNTALGYYALSDVTSGPNNTAIGRAALNSNTTGYSNVAVGANNLINNTTGWRNTAIGHAAGQAIVSGTGNVFIGHDAGYWETDSNKLYINNTNTSSPLIYGDFSSDNLVFNGNVGIGTTSPNEKLVFNGNLFMSGGDIKTDRWLSSVTNCLIGVGVAGAGNLSHASGQEGYYNTSIGSQSFYSNTTGEQNTASGYAALGFNTTGYQNTAFGFTALDTNTTGNKNTAIGYQALYTVNPTTGGEGENNIGIGYNAGDNITTGSTNIIIGSNIDAPSATGNNQLNIGNTIYGDLSSGNVGIGTVTPIRKLEVIGGSDLYSQLVLSDVDTDNALKYGGVNILSYDSDEEPLMIIGGHGASTYNEVYIGGGHSGVNSASTLRFYPSSSVNTVSGTERLTINSSGNIGIGTSSPSEKLHVSGSIKGGANGGQTFPLKGDGAVVILIDDDNNQTDRSFEVWNDS